MAPKYMAGKDGGAPLGSRQGGAPEALDAQAVMAQGRVHRTRTERAAQRENTPLNHASKEAGSQDQGSGSPTISDIDLIPELPDS